MRAAMSRVAMARAPKATTKVATKPAVAVAKLVVAEAAVVVVANVRHKVSASASTLKASRSRWMPRPQQPMDQPRRHHVRQNKARNVHPATQSVADAVVAADVAGANAPTALKQLARTNVASHVEKDAPSALSVNRSETATRMKATATMPPTGTSHVPTRTPQRPHW